MLLNKAILLTHYLWEQNLIQATKELIKMIWYHKYIFMDGSSFDRVRKYETWKQILKGSLDTKGYINRVDSEVCTAAWGDVFRCLLYLFYFTILCHWAMATSKVTYATKVWKPKNAIPKLRICSHLKWKIFEQTFSPHTYCPARHRPRWIPNHLCQQQWGPLEELIKETAKQ